MNNYTTTFFNVTTSSSVTPVSFEITGFIVAVLASVGFGTNYIPVKKYETGDGLIFQWIFGSAVLVGGFITNAVVHFPKFEPLVLLGGAIWATGNMCTVPIVKNIGLGLGLLVWSCTSNIVGWVVTRFGLFGMKPQVPEDIILNYIGFAVIAICPVIYALVKPELKETLIVPVEPESAPLIDHSVNATPRTRSPWKYKIIGFGLSLFAGVCYGLMFVPVIYIKDNYPGASQNDIDYLFAQCVGIYLTSTLGLLVYCLVKCNKPDVYPSSILPSILSGSIWFLAYLCFFVGNSLLSANISQPIITALSGLISILVGVLIYREIKGMRNYTLVIVAMATTLVGVILTGISKSMKVT